MFGLWMESMGDVLNVIDGSRGFAFWLGWSVG